MLERLKLRWKIAYARRRCLEALDKAERMADSVDCGLSLLRYMSPAFVRAERDYHRYGRLYRRLKFKLDQLIKVGSAA